MNTKKLTIRNFDWEFALKFVDKKYIFTVSASFIYSDYTDSADYVLHINFSGIVGFRYYTAIPAAIIVHMPEYLLKEYIIEIFKAFGLTKISKQISYKYKNDIETLNKILSKKITSTVY